LGVFYIYPLLSIVVYSFGRSSDNWFSPFILAFRSPGIRNVLSFTFTQAILSTLLTLAVGLPGAFVLARYNFRGKMLLRALTSIPFVLPTLVTAAAFNALLGSRGWINLVLMQVFSLSQPPLQLVNSLTAILIAHVFYNTTIVLRMVGDFWTHLDPRMAQAARTLGANRWQAMIHITLPLLAPAIIAASLLVFIFNFTSFGVILVLGGPRFSTIEVEIYTQTIGLFNLPLAASLALIQLACTLGLTIIYTWLANRLARPSNLRSTSYTQKTIIGWRSRLLVGCIVIVLISLHVIPLVSLAVRSFVQYIPESATEKSQMVFTLEHYRELGANRRGSLFFAPPTTAIATSLGYASMTMLFALALGMPAAWTLARRSELLSSRALDVFIMLPLGTSAVTLGLGFILALNRPPIDLRASPIIIPLAHTLVAFPFVVRSLTPALRSIRPQLRHAAAMLGASPMHTIRHIDLPLIGRAMLTSAAFAFSISLGEFGATTLIARPEFPTIPILIYRFLSQPGAINYGQALALSTILMSVTALAILAIERLRIADIGEF
jgi:thiamine transport system permease protein